MSLTDPPVTRAAAGSAKLLAPVIGLSLATIAVAVYLSPAGASTPLQSTAADFASHHRSSSSASHSSLSNGSSGSSSQNSSHSASDPSTTHSAQPTDTSERPGPTMTKIVTSSAPGKVVHATATITKDKGPSAEYCTQFAWQQDAQAAYDANLSDPYGLDGKPGPHNGDGLACTQLPVDPSRPASTAVDPYVPPSPSTKAALVRPSQDYYGVTEDGLPGDTGMLATIDTSVGKAPSEIGWFSYWDSGFDTAKVRETWTNGALPMITWMSVPSNSKAANAGSYTLANIVSGQFDSYLLQYAGAVLANGEPVAIRFDHEMNGNWFPWAAGLAANKGASGQPNLYVKAWQHVWNLFNSVGANADVVWVWAPNRVDTLTPDSQTGGTKGQTGLAEDYPGDQYVDWLGMSAYSYKPTDGFSYSVTFKNTLNGLHAVSNKPIFVAETGATEAVGTTDYAPQKAAWTQATLSGLLADPSVVGFSWFNNNVTDVHQVDGVSIQTNWQFSSAPQVLAAFAAGVGDSRYSSGVMPDGTGG